MCRNNANLVVGMTTFYDEFLGLSIPVLARIKQKFILIIHNDNPDTKISKRQIRKLGYRGRLYIINSKYNVGQLRARLAILGLVAQKKLKAKWFLFADDEDFVLDAKIPDVASNHFAVIQNMLVIKNRLVDVLRIIKSPTKYNIDDDNICVVRPHIGLAGTLVRLNAIMELGRILTENIIQISDIDESLNHRPPVDMMMWSALNIIANAQDTNATPIYMDNVNYVATKLDYSDKKYGQKKDSGQQAQRAIEKYNRVILAALGINDAAPAGQ